MDEQEELVMEPGEEVVSSEPASPSAQYLNSSVLSLSIIAVLESEIPIDDSQTLQLLKDVFLPINPRFSSLMVRDSNGVQKWKRVEVKPENHIKVPLVPDGMSMEFYDDCFGDYLTNLAMEQLPQTQPLWEIHVIKYPTSNAAGSLIFKLHHALGDGFSLMGALLSCLQRADNPSLPLTFPSRQPTPKPRRTPCRDALFRRLPRIFFGIIRTISDFGGSLMKSSLVEDDRTPIRSGLDGVEFMPVVISTMTFSLDQIKQIKDKLHVTVNDVISGIIFYGTRLYMDAERREEGGTKMMSSKSTALVLLNTRAIGGYKSIHDMVRSDAEMPWGNQFAFLHVAIPNITKAEASNPLSFVIKAHRIIKRKRNSLAVYLTGMLLDALRKLRGSEATARYIHSTLSKSSMGISNLIGPVEKMALANHPVKGLYFAVAGIPQSLTIAVVSYVGKLRVSVAAEKGFIDSKKFNSCIEDAFNMMLKAAVHSASP